MDYDSRDFNGADTYFANEGKGEWDDLDALLSDLTPHFQPSDEAKRVGTAIFDPKGTNAALHRAAADRGWVVIPVPEELTMFGDDWDAGKGETLVEWQFSNYPFLWNNVIRTQAVVSGRIALAIVGTVKALVVVTKSGLFPASQSTLYFEQAEAQLETVFKTGAFSLPVRLVGLKVAEGVEEIDAIWSTYAGRYSRQALSRDPVRMHVEWGRRNKYGTLKATFEEATAEGA